MLTFNWVVDQPVFLKTFLSNKGVSRRLLARIKFHGGEILVNGQQRYVKHVLNAGDNVTVLMPPEGTQDIIEPIDKPIEILFEDDHFIFINKPAGFTSIPSQYNPQGSMANILKAYYQQQNYTDQVIHVVTRLDRDTSGVMMFAKHQFAHGLIDQSMREKGVNKRYSAFTHQPLSRSNHGIVEAPIGRADHSIIERRVVEGGKPAKTEYWLHKEFGDIYMYDIQLHTGRTHQIRVHFAYSGAPLAGDDLYGGRVEPKLKRQALHCHAISFYHPFRQKEVMVEAPLAPDIQEWLAARNSE